MSPVQGPPAVFQKLLGAFFSPWGRFGARPWSTCWCVAVGSLAAVRTRGSSLAISLRLVESPPPAARRPLRIVVVCCWRRHFFSTSNKTPFDFSPPSPYLHVPYQLANKLLCQLHLFPALQLLPLTSTSSSTSCKSNGCSSLPVLLRLPFCRW